jgi:hypothetical protein
MAPSNNTNNSNSNNISSVPVGMIVSASKRIKKLEDQMETVENAKTLKRWNVPKQQEIIDLLDDE